MAGGAEAAGAAVRRAHAAAPARLVRVLPPAPLRRRLPRRGRGGGGPPPLAAAHGLALRHRAIRVEARWGSRLCRGGSAAAGPSSPVRSNSDEEGLAVLDDDGDPISYI